jgi:hypothetical protein
MSSVYCKYGTYFLSPVPLVTISNTMTKTADGTPIGSLFSLTLNGTIETFPSGGLVRVDAKQDLLLNAFKSEGELFHIYCSGDGEAANDIIKGYARINSVQFNESSNNWVFTAPYVIELELDQLALTGTTFISPYDSDWLTIHNVNSGVAYISDASEDWQLEFLDNAPFTLNLAGGTDKNSTPLRLTHTVSAVGIRHFSSSGLAKQAWQQAKDYVLLRLGFDNTQLLASEVLNLNASGYISYNHVRSQTIDELAGVFTVAESWLVSNTGAGIIPNGIENFTVSIRQGVQSDITTVEINGEIEGLETRTYGQNTGDFSISLSKYAGASGYFNTVQSKLYDRCLYIAGSTPSRTLNINPLSEVVAHSPSRGAVSYTYEYDDRPYNIIAGAISESITISDDAPVDIFASLVVPGRSAGPILQDIGTTTARVRHISIEVIVPPYTGGVNNTTDVAALISAAPETAVNSLLDKFVLHLSGLYGQVFLSNDRPTWQPKLGIYGRDVSYTVGIC